MATFKLTAYEARDGRSVVFNLGKPEPPFPPNRNLRLEPAS